MTTATATATIIHHLRDPETGRVLHPSRYAKDMQVIAVGTGPEPKPFGRILGARWQNGDEPTEDAWRELADLVSDGKAWRQRVSELGGDLVSMVVAKWIPLDDEGQPDNEGQS